MAVAGGSALPIPNFHKRTASISTLPEELVVKILSYLPHFPGLTRCSTVNKKWHRLSTSEELWRQVYLGEVRAAPPKTCVDLSVSLWPRFSRSRGPSSRVAVRENSER